MLDILSYLLHDRNADIFLQIWIFLELLFVYFFYIETRGPTLEELAKIFDGENAEVSHIDIHEVEKELRTGDKLAALDEKAGIYSTQYDRTPNV